MEDALYWTPDRLLAFAVSSHLTKLDLAGLLTPETREVFLQTCSDIERDYTHACGTSGDPCLEAGCSFEDEENICLQPVLRAGEEYHRRCAEAWVKFFVDPANRAVAWRH